MSNAAINQIIAQVSDLLAPVDAKNLLDTIAKAHQTRIALFAKIKELAANRRAMREEVYYAEMFAVAGSKSAYKMLYENSPETIATMLTTQSMAKAEARNVKIAEKLNKAGVETCSDADIVYNSDGFQGSYKVQTNVGEKFVTIDVIIAGGWNVQCAHYRCLVKVR